VGFIDFFVVENFAALLKIHFQFIRAQAETAVVQPCFIEHESEEEALKWRKSHEFFKP
jgi:hypothetical protein